MTTGQIDWSLIRRGLLSLFITASVLLVVFQPLDDLGSTYLDKSFKQALASFAIARGLNGVISVAQGTEIAVQPAGVGINFTPGEILDPVNDLVERFSWVMLLSSSSLGAQKVLLSVSSWIGLAAGFVLVSGLYLMSLWWKPRSLGAGRQWISRVFVFLLILRFSVPMIAVLNEWVYQGFLVDQYNSATNELKKASDDISEINLETSAELSATNSDEGLLDKAKQLYDSAIDQMDISDKLNRYSLAAEQVSENTIQLIVVYLLQTVLFPLLFLWGITRLFRQLFSF